MDETGTGIRRKWKALGKKVGMEWKKLTTLKRITRTYQKLSGLTDKAQIFFTATMRTTKFLALIEAELGLKKAHQGSLELTSYYYLIPIGVQKKN